MKSSSFRAILLIIPALLIGQQAFGQFGTGSQDPRLYINSVDNRTEYIEIQYEITSSGYIELQLFDKEENRLWITGKVTDRVGKDVIRIPTGPLKSGERYTFVLKYKGKEYDSFFYMN